MRKFKFHYNLTRITSTLPEEQYTFFIIFLSFILRMRNISDKSCRENQNNYFMSKNDFFFENRAVYEIMWKNILQPGRTQMRIWLKCIVCWIPKATNTHSECVILTAFSLQQWLYKRGSMLRYTYIACQFLFSTEARNAWSFTSTRIYVLIKNR